MPRLQRIPRPGKPAPSLEDRRLARRWFLRRLALAASRGETSITLSTRLGFALRPMLITGLGEPEASEREWRSIERVIAAGCEYNERQRQRAPRGPAAA